MANNCFPQTTLWLPPILHGDITVTMPRKFDRHDDREFKLPNEIFSRLGTQAIPSLPSRLFTIPLDIFEHILDRMTKRDVSRLSQTCKTFMWQSSILKAKFYEPVSIKEIAYYYQSFPNYSISKSIMGPPVTWGINAFTGPFVRRLAVPEWISEQDIHYLTAHCPNLDTLDFMEIFDSEEDFGSDSGSNKTEGDIDIWPSMLDRCPALFKNLTSVHLPYGCWTMYNRLQDYQRTHSARLPEFLHLAGHLKTLELTFQQEPTLDLSPESRRDASAKLFADIFEKVSSELTTLGLYGSESTIENLESFLQSLAFFPKLRTIKLSLHSDLHRYERDSQPRYGLDLIVDPILSSPNKDYEHDTASVLQYLSTIKKISDRGRFSIVSIDRGETYHSTPRDYYGLCHTELVHGPRDNLWTPIWTWNDRFDWVQSHQNHPSVETLDIGKCRALFGELTKARIPVSIVLEPLSVPFGAMFTSPWDKGVSNLNAYLQPLPGYEGTTLSDGRLPKNRLIQQRVLITVTSKHALLFHGMPTWIDDQPLRTISVELPVVEQKLKPWEFKDSLGHHALGVEARVPRSRWTQQWSQRGSTALSNESPYINPAAPDTTDAKIEVPDPIWRLDEVGDLIDDLRLHWHRGFAYVYTNLFFEHCEGNPNWFKWSYLMHKCRSHLRGRFWREAEYTALLFRRIPVDFPRLTRLALYIPTALYPDQDQTFIDHALPGTGWTVKHHGSVGGCDPPIPNPNKTCLKLADDICPFIRRIFTRPTPSDDPCAIIVHDEEWHVTKRPLFDLDGEYKSMEQLLTEPLGDNYTKEEE